MLIWWATRLSDLSRGVNLEIMSFRRLLRLTATTNTAWVLIGSWHISSYRVLAMEALNECGIAALAWAGTYDRSQNEFM